MKTRILVERPFAHRGLHSGNNPPENSLAAFGAAIEAGYAIELDIRLPGVGPPIVFHDPDFERMTGVSGLVRETNIAETGHLRLHCTDQHVPTLSETLDYIAGRVPVLIELKASGAAGRLERETLDILKRYSGACAVQSFNWATVAWFLREAPDILCGHLFDRCEDIGSGRRDGITPDFVGLEVGILHCRPPDSIVLVWTCRSESEGKQAMRHADNIIFEDYLPWRVAPSSMPGPA